MSKKTVTLILFLFLVTCGLLYLAVVTPPYKKQTIFTPTPTPLSVNAHTILNLTPASASMSSQTNQYTLAVGIDTGENVVNGVQLELAYDPQALTNITISKGTFFKQPSELINNVNTTDGRISYALVEQVDLPGQQGTGTVALVSFDIAPGFTGKTTTLTFLPKTAVSANKVLESVLKQTTNYTLPIAKIVPPSTTGVSPLPTSSVVIPISTSPTK